MTLATKEETYVAHNPTYHTYSRVKMQINVHTQIIYTSYHTHDLADTNNHTIVEIQLIRIVDTSNHTHSRYKLSYPQYMIYVIILYIVEIQAIIRRVEIQVIIRI